MRKLLILAGFLLFCTNLIADSKKEHARIMSDNEFFASLVLDRLIKEQAIFEGFTIQNDDNGHYHINSYVSKDGSYKGMVIVGYLTKPNKKIHGMIDGIPLKPLFYKRCLSEKEPEITTCAFFEVKYTKPPHEDNPMKPIKLTKNQDYYIDKAIPLRATVYGFGEWMCGPIGKPRRCKDGAVTASGEMFRPNMVLSAAVPMPTDSPLTTKVISLRVGNGKCVKVRINDKSNPRWIGKRGLDLSPAVIFASTGKKPTKIWSGYIKRC